MNEFNWKLCTEWVTYLGIPLMVVLVLIYDWLAVKYGGTEASISSLLIVLFHKVPMAVVAVTGPFFYLLGHLTWRMKGNKDTAALDNEYKSNEPKH